MKQRPRIYYNEAQKALMWDRWRKGESLQHIAELFDRNHSSIQRILAETGGIQPPARRRSRLALTVAEREEISRAVVAADRCVRLPLRSAGLHRLSAGKSRATAAWRAIGRARPTRPPGIGRDAPRSVDWQRIERWRA